jgi:hypothetical protein
MNGRSESSREYSSQGRGRLGGAREAGSDRAFLFGYSR